MMQVRVRAGEIQTVEADAIVLGWAEDVTALDAQAAAVNEVLDGALAALLEAGDFTGKAGQTTLLYAGEKQSVRRVLLVGLGKQDEISVEAVRRAAAHALKALLPLQVKHVATAVYGMAEDRLPLPEAVSAVVEGSLLAAYKYQAAGKTKADNAAKGPDMLELVIDSEADVSAAQAAVQEAEQLAAGVLLARDLVNMPPNFCTPAHLAETAMGMVGQVGLRVQVLERGQMQALGMGALLAVAQGSDAPPRFIILEHNAAQAAELPSVVLVGKGVTFDTGGYNLKSGEGMGSMKTDMAGGAAVLGAMRAIAGLNIPLHVVGLVPASDNMINGGAYRPQEVVTASNGVTIEVVSTDAEGRMLLADALVFAERFEPVAVVDIATLTGACVVALGRGMAAGLFATDDGLRDALVAAGSVTGERVWPMPLFPEYESTLESDVADLKHSGGKGGGVGASATFLRHFVNYPWAHVDMAGMASDLPDTPYAPAGASGYGVRLLVEFVRRRVSA
ncbi:MAG: leucyl aminopeptidase [Anaerolineae bacterium]|nr:leucyl aminopeptidase [Anaerolineae bacterium]